MGKIIHAEPNDIIKILDCFCNEEELQAFIKQFNASLDFASLISASSSEEDTQEYLEMAVASQIFTLGLFFQKNIDIIHSIIKNLNYTFQNQELTDKCLRIPNFLE